MFKKFHGFDLHKKYATISVRDENGKEIYKTLRCMDLRGYINSLNNKDIVVVEAVNNAFYWADEIEKQGAICLVINPFKFKMIRESIIKTDRKDSINLSLALWISMTSKEFKIPTVYKPDPEIRELRKLFSQYQLINKQIRQYKNSIQAVLVENGIMMTNVEKERLLNPRHGLDVFDSLKVTRTSRVCTIMSLFLLWNLQDQKELLKREIFKAGLPLEDKMKLLITIKGVTPLLALGFLADIGDITRFKSVRQMNSYLGVVPTVKSSGGKTKMGSINRQSRNLSRSLFTQGIIHFVKDSSTLFDFYESVKKRRGVGRSRIAVLRKLFSIMRRMLLNNEEYKWKDDINYNNKLVDYEKLMMQMKNLADAS